MSKSAETEAFDAKISRQRLDTFDRPDGSVESVLTVTLPGVATPFVFREVATAEEARADLGGSVSGEFADDDVAGIFDDIGKAVKSVGKGIAKAAKSVATSKVFRAAAKGLAVAAPVLGPLAPVALTASGAMLTTSALVGARRKAAAGDKKGAAAMTVLAAKAAKKIAPKNARKLLKIAGDKSRAAHAIAVATPKPSKKRKAKKSKPAARPSTRTTIVRPTSSAPRALLGPGNPLGAAELLAAARAGRVFVVKAA